MIIKELFITRVDGVKLFRVYSDEGRRLVQNETGAVYDEAVDVEDAPYTYSESEESVEGFEETVMEEKAAAYDVLTGVVK